MLGPDAEVPLGEVDDPALGHRLEALLALAVVPQPDPGVLVHLHRQEGYSGVLSGYQEGTPAPPAQPRTLASPPPPPAAGCPHSARPGTAPWRTEGPRLSGHSDSTHVWCYRLQKMLRFFNIDN